MSSSSDGQWIHWPRYAEWYARPSLAQYARAVLGHRDSLKQLGAIGLLVAAYVLGTTQLTIPYSDPTKVRALVERSPFLELLDVCLTGGAFTNLSPLAFGMFATLLLMKRSVTLSGNRMRMRLWVALPAYLSAGLMATLLATALVALEAVPRRASIFALTALLLTLGIYVTFYIERKLDTLAGSGILDINIALLLGKYLVDLIRSRHLSGFLTLLAIVGFAFALKWLSRHRARIEVVNIRTEEPRVGVLPIPSSNSVIRLSWLLLVWLSAGVLMSLGSFFFGTQLSPFRATLAGAAILTLTQLGLILAVTRTPMASEFLSRISSLATARRLRIAYWIIPEANDDQETAAFLRARIAKAHRLTWLFYFVWLSLFLALDLIPQQLSLASATFPFGPLILVLVLTLCSELAQELLGAAWRHIRRLAQAGSVEIGSVAIEEETLALEALQLRDAVEGLLNRLTGPERQVLERLVREVSYEGRPIAASDIRVLLRQLQALPRTAPDDREISWRGIIAKFIGSVVITLVTTAAGIWLTQLFTGHNIDASIKAGLIALAIGSLLAGFSLCGMDEDIRLKLQRRPTRPSEDVDSSSS